MSGKGIALCLGILLVCTGIMGCAKEEPSMRVVSEKLIAGIDLSAWIKESLRVSPDSKRLAYATKAGHIMSIVVDGKEGKRYDAVVLS